MKIILLAALAALAAPIVVMAQDVCDFDVRQNHSSGTARWRVMVNGDTVPVSGNNSIDTAVRSAKWFLQNTPRGTEVRVVYDVIYFCLTGSPLPPPPPPPPPPPAVAGDTIYASSMDSMGDVINPRIGSGAGAIQQGGSFTGSGYLASVSPDRLAIPQSSIGLDLAQGTAIFTYIPGYDSNDGSKKRDILFMGSWGTPGFHFGKHQAANSNGLYWQFADATGQHALETLSHTHEPWASGDVLNIRITWDMADAPSVIRTWINGCEVPGIQSSVPAGALPGAAQDSVVIGSRRGPHTIFGQGEVTDLVILDIAQPGAGTCSTPPPAFNAADSTTVIPAKMNVMLDSTIAMYAVVYWAGVGYLCDGVDWREAALASTGAGTWGSRAPGDPLTVRAETSKPDSAFVVPGGLVWGSCGSAPSPVGQQFLRTELGYVALGGER